ncbi:MAG: GntR family transcriptional regulator [Woeseia sp.]
MDALNNDAIDRKPLHSEVAERLRSLIVQGELAPGDRLNERVLAERFNISRTPLREAIKILALEGLVRLLPNRGAEVTQLTRSNVEDMFQVVGALEALAGELACQRASDDDIAEIRRLHNEMWARFEAGDRAEYFTLNQRIHAKIVDCAGNAELSAIYRNLAQRLHRARYMANFSKDRWSHAMQEHEEILDAIASRDSARLNSILKSHLQNKFDAIKNWLDESGDGRSAANNGAAVDAEQDRKTAYS